MPPNRASAARRQRSWPAIAVFLTPALAIFGAFVLLPIAVAAYTSLYRWNGFGIPRDFVGLDNFRNLVTDRILVGDLGRGALLIALSLGIQLPAALALAMLLNQPLRGRRWYRVVFFTPYVLSETITAVLFTMVFSPTRGLASRVPAVFGLDELATTWLSNPRTVMFSVFFVMSWKYFGFYAMLYLAGRQGIPAELHEAACLDGAGAWQGFRHVTLPLLGPTIRISAFISVLGSIQLFDMVWVLTGGGPVRSSETLAVTMFQEGFKRFRVGYASAISVTIFLLSLVFGLFYQRLILRRDLRGAVTTAGNLR